MCPTCGLPFRIAKPETGVSVSVCPQPSCQIVSFVVPASRFNRRLAGRDHHGYQAVALAEWVRAPKLRDLPEVLILAIVGLFVVIPLWMCGQALRVDEELFVQVLLLTTPALVFGSMALVALGFDVAQSLASWRRTSTWRRRALARPRWVASTDAR